MKNNNILKLSGKYWLICVLGLLTSFSFSACGLIVPESSGEGETAMRATILYPEESAQFYIGDYVDITSAIGDSAGLTASILTINSDPIRFDQFVSSIESGKIYQPWIPFASGVYQLQILVETGAGGRLESNVVTVYVGERPAAAQENVPEQTDEEEIQPEVDECSEPTATTTGYANCRSGPGTAYNLVVGLKPKESFLILSKSGTETWFEVERTSNGVTCWVWTKLIDICGNTNGIPTSSLPEKDEVIEEKVPEEPIEEDPVEEEPPDGPTIPTKDPGSGPTTP